MSAISCLSSKFSLDSVDNLIKCFRVLPFFWLFPKEKRKGNRRNKSENSAAQHESSMTGSPGGRLGVFEDSFLISSAVRHFLSVEVELDLIFSLQLRKIDGECWECKGMSLLDRSFKNKHKITNLFHTSHISLRSAGQMEPVRELEPLEQDFRVLFLREGRKTPPIKDET